MSHLAEVYAKDLGVRIGEPIFKPHFFPILESEYITIHTDNKVSSKEYDYWEEVILIVKKSCPKIKFIQIGSGKEPIIKNADRFAKTNSIKQSAYIIKNGIMHVGTDSLPVHIASSFKKKIVSIYSHTHSATCNPIWGNAEDSIIIESHRDGKKPSFSLRENPKTINLINPEQIADAILKNLKETSSGRETLFIGQNYKNKITHIIPDKKYDCVDKNIIIRLDLLHNEDNISHLFSQNKVSIVTKKTLSEETISYKNIQVINYFSDSFNEDFVNLVKQKGISLNLFCTKKKNLSEQRFKFFDHKILLFSKRDKIKKSRKLVDLKNKDFKIKSYGLYYKNGMAHSSLYQANEGKNINDIFLDLEHLMIYTDRNE
jgi:hypothetical protein